MNEGTNAASCEAGREGSVWTRSETLRSIAIVLLFVAAAAAMWPLTSAVVPWDSKNHFYPMLRYLGAALQHGELPLWNPYHFSGHPSVADPQALLFTPTMLLFAWLVPSPSTQLFDAVVFAHFLPGALGVLLLFRKRGWRPAGAVLAAMIFMLGGSASARLQHTGMIFSYGFFPLALWLLEEALDRRSYPYALLLAAVAAMMTVGRDQVAFLCALTLFGAVVWRAWEAENRLGFIKSRAGVLLTAGAVGATLLMTSTRPSFGFGVAAMGSLPPASLATMFFGDIFGSLRTTYDYWGPDWQSMAAGTWTDRATNYLFAGTIPGLLLLWHGIAGGRLFAREFRFFLIVGLVAIVYALGRYTPLFEIVFDRLPGVALYRRPADATFLINFVLAFAAGYLLHRWLEESSPRRAGLKRLASSSLAGLLLAAALAGALAFAWRASHLPDALLDIAL